LTLFYARPGRLSISRPNLITMLPGMAIGDDSCIRTFYAASLTTPQAAARESRVYLKL